MPEKAASARTCLSGADSTTKKRQGWPLQADGASLAASRQRAGELVEAALEALRVFDAKADPLREIAAYIVKRKS